MPPGHAPPVIVRGFENLVIRVYVRRTRNGGRPNAERPNQTSRLGRFDPQFARGLASNQRVESRCPVRKHATHPVKVRLDGVFGLV
jgi:hypothetical protein